MKSSELEYSLSPKSLLLVSILGLVNLGKVGQTSFPFIAPSILRILAPHLHFDALAST